MSRKLDKRVEALLKWFAYKHLPKHLQEVSKPFCDVAEHMAWDMEMSSDIAQLEEMIAGLRKLLEAKDCFVRAAILAPSDQ